MALPWFCLSQQIRCLYTRLTLDGKLDRQLCAAVTYQPRRERKYFRSVYLWLGRLNQRRLLRGFYSLAQARRYLLTLPRGSARDVMLGRLFLQNILIQVFIQLGLIRSTGVKQ